jgi:hypothetical protein
MELSSTIFPFSLDLAGFDVGDQCVLVVHGIKFGWGCDILAAEFSPKGAKVTLRRKAKD